MLKFSMTLAFFVSCCGPPPSVPHLRLIYLKFSPHIFHKTNPLELGASIHIRLGPGQAFDDEIAEKVASNLRKAPGNFGEAEV